MIREPIARRPTAELVNLPRLSGGTLVVLDLEAEHFETVLMEVYRSVKANFAFTPDYDIDLKRILRKGSGLGPQVVHHSVAMFHDTARVAGPVVQVLVRLAKPLHVSDEEGGRLRFVWILISSEETHPHIPAAAEFCQLMSDSAFREQALEATTPEALEQAYREALAQELAHPEAELPAELRPTRRAWGGLVQDIRRRLPHYRSDFLGGMSSKVLASTIFLYFACLAPCVAFGGLLFVHTNGEVGAVEVIVATAIGGVAYGLFSGQPLTFVGSTGPVITFMIVLYDLCQAVRVPYLPALSWIGLWTAFFLVVLVMTDACSWIRYFTRFTDDVFSGLISLIFIHAALKDLISNFTDDQTTYEAALLSLLLGAGTYTIAMRLSHFRRSPYLRRPIREFFADFGPAIALLAMTVLSIVPAFQDIKIATLSLPDSFTTTSGRPWLVNPFVAPRWVWAASALPALLAAVLLYLDQNITVRLVNSKGHRLKKGSAYHLDLLVVAALTGAFSLFGLPWVVAATVRSINHLRSLATVRPSRDGERDYISSVVETRVSGIAVHILIGLSLLLVPALHFVPMPVLFGLFLFMGVASMAGNQLFERLKLVAIDPSYFPPTHYLRAVPGRIVNGYTAVQGLCLALLWFVKVSAAAIVFPLFIAFLVPIRMVLRRYFRAEYLALLDGEEQPEEEESRFAGA